VTIVGNNHRPILEKPVYLFKKLTIQDEVVQFLHLNNETMS